MEQQDRQNGLRQKVRLGQVEGQARAVSLARALRLTLAKVGEELFDLPLAACRLPCLARPPNCEPTANFPLSLKARIY